MAQQSVLSTGQVLREPCLTSPLFSSSPEALRLTKFSCLPLAQTLIPGWNGDWEGKQDNRGTMLRGCRSQDHPATGWVSLLPNWPPLAMQAEGHTVLGPAALALGNFLQN